MSNCILGDIIYPSNNVAFITDKYPFQIPVEVATITPLNDFIVQISLDPNFRTSDGYISTEGIFETPILNLYLPGKYYFRISCDGINWSPVAIFTLSTVPAIDISPINIINVELNSESNGFDVYMPQFLYGAPILSLPISSLHYSPGVEINISNSSTFNAGVLRFYNYSHTVGKMYKTSCILSNINLNLTYYFRARTLIPTNISNGNNTLIWGPYTYFSSSWQQGVQSNVPG